MIFTAMAHLLSSFALNIMVMRPELAGSATATGLNCDSDTFQAYKTLLSTLQPYLQEKSQSDFHVHWLDLPNDCDCNGTKTCTHLWTPDLATSAPPLTHTSLTGGLFNWGTLKTNAVGTIILIVYNPEQQHQQQQREQETRLTSQFQSLHERYSNSFTNRLEIVYMLLPLKVFPSRIVAQQEMESIVQLVGSLSSIGDATYVIALHEHGPERQELNSASDILVQESYHIRDKIITRVIPAGGHGAGSWLADLSGFNLVRRRSNFERATVVGVDQEDPEYASFTKFREGSDELESGFDVFVYRCFRDALNFTEKSVKGIGYIGPGPNGSLVGLAAQIRAGEADIGIGMTDLIPYRMRGPDAISVLMPALESGLHAFFKQPPASTVRNVFTKPFSVGLWSSLAGFMIVIVLAIKMATATATRSIEESSPILSTAAMICQQGWHTAPSETSTKIIALFGAVAALILYVAYSGELVSILSVSLNPITEFKDLVTYGFVIVNNAQVPQTTLTVKTMEETGELPRVPYDRAVDAQEKIHELPQSRLALITPSEPFYSIAALKNYSDDYVCANFDHVPAPVSGGVKMGPCVGKGSPLRVFFNNVMVSIIERGVLARLGEAALKNMSVRCLKASIAANTDLSLRDVSSAYFVLGLGCVSSAIICVIEKLHHHRHL